MMARLSSSLDHVASNVRTFGWSNATHDALLRSLNRLAYARILKCVMVERPPADAGRGLALPHGFAKPEQLRRWAADPEYAMTPEFVERAAFRGDQCYAIWDGDVLASYGWYSSRPTDVTEDLTLSFDPAYVYMYKGFTHPQYRGQRLHAIGMTLALTRAREQGFAGLVSYVESNNFSSLRSCYRMGYREVGSISFVRVWGRYLIRHSIGCERYALRLEAKVPVALSRAPRVA